MTDRRNTPPRPVPATIDAHRVTVPRGPGAPRPAVVPPAPAVHAPSRRPGAEAETARLERTVDALRRLQVTLAGAQDALDAVIAEVQSAVGPDAGRRGTPRALGAAPEMPAATARATRPGSARPRG